MKNKIDWQRETKDARKIWIDGLNHDLLRRWRRAVDRQTQPKLILASRALARQLRDCKEKRPLPLYATCTAVSLDHGTSRGELIQYLATLGVGLLVSLSPTEEEE